VALIAISKTKLKRVVETASPCLTPFCVSNSSEHVSCITTLTLVLVKDSYLTGEIVRTKLAPLSQAQNMKMFLRYITNHAFPRGIEELGSHQSTVLKTMLALTRSTVELTNQCIFSFS
jgi:hypothetical protein